MCGIIGFNWNDEKLVKKLNDLLAHRGPDQKGCYCDPRVSIAHRRLSILDLSPNGVQPMGNENGDVLVLPHDEAKEVFENMNPKHQKLYINKDTKKLRIKSMT